MSYVYRGARNAEDYRKARRLMKAESIKPSRLSFPTILAFEDEELVGFLGTDLRQDMVVAGPLVLRSDRRRTFLALRLAEMYEQAMRELGIKSLILACQPDSLTHKAIKRYFPGLEPYAKTETELFFIRRL